MHGICITWVWLWLLFRAALRRDSPNQWHTPFASSYITTFGDWGINNLGGVYAWLVCSTKYGGAHAEPVHLAIRGLGRARDGCRGQRCVTHRNAPGCTIWLHWLHWLQTKTRCRTATCRLTTPRLTYAQAHHATPHATPHHLVRHTPHPHAVTWYFRRTALRRTA